MMCCAPTTARSSDSAKITDLRASTTIGHRFLPGKVGRRLLLLFVLAAMAPLALLALYSLSRVSDELLVARHAELIQASKSYGMQLVGRIRLVESELRAAQLAEPEPLSVMARRLAPSVTGVAHVRNQEVLEAVGSLSGVKTIQVPAAKAALTPSPDSGSLWLSVPAPGTDSHLVAAFRPDYLWGSLDEYPTQTDFIVLEHTGRVVYRSRSLPVGVDAVLRQQLQTGAHKGSTEFDDGADDWHLGYWTLAVTDLDNGRLLIGAGQPGDYVQAPVTAFHRAFIPVALLSALAACLLAFTQTRRLLQPLEELRSAAARIGRNDFSAQAMVRGDNEFATLAGAFNTMSDTIGRQLATLHRYAEIDRIVLTTLDMRAVAEKALQQIRLLTDAAVVVLQFEDEYGVHCFRLDTAGMHSSQGEASAASEGTLTRHYDIRHRDERLGCLAIHEPRVADDAAELAVGGYLDRIAIALAAAQRERRLVRQARMDSLTGLPNRAYFLEHLQQAVGDAVTHSERGTLLFLDLDRFKRTNDVLGHVAGDTLLKLAADRLNDTVGAEHFLARLGGDEFTVVCRRTHDPQVIEALATRLIERLSEPFEIDGRTIFVGLSIGSATFPDDGDTALDLLRRADTAMYRAKQRGGARYAAFHTDMEGDLSRSLTMDAALREAITQGRFELYYQAKADMQSGRVSGAEALIRWIDPDGMVLDTPAWMAHAETTPMINEIGAWALTRACSQLREWDEAGWRLPRVAVNVAARQLTDSGFYEDVVNAISTAGIAPHRLQLEITESQLMTDPAVSLPLLRRLTALGVTIAADDFGTGYSSFSLLRQLPLSVLKVDASFIADIDADPSARAVVQAIVRMGHALQLRVVAEGVETVAQRKVLAEIGCDTVQGYLIGRPIPAYAFMLAYQDSLAVEH